MPNVTFTGRIEPTRLSAAYQAGLLVTAIAMLLLPLVYVTLIMTAAAAVWWHLTANAWILGKGAAQFRLLAYLAPAFAGVVLTFFMVKPILARPARRRDALTVTPEGQPALFALIDQICQQVRAPRPRRVNVNCEVNAYAGFLRGPFNPFQRDLVLTIGLPLAAGLTVRQLAGVIAHEFGHFAQGGGMRLTAIVRGVNGWFTRVVYERDEWDEKLERWSKDSGGYVVIAVGLARGAVWLTRRVLLGLMYGGHAISCFMARQMEYDADSYEFKVAGTDAFVRTMVRLRELNMASHFAYNDMREGFHRASLPADVPVFIVERGGRLPPELLEQIRTSSDTKTGVFDTHPSDADRIRAAEVAQAPGMIVNADVPATGLFLDFDALSRAVTRHHFEHDLGLDVGALTLIETSAAMRDTQIRADNWNAIRRLFGERWSALRPLHVPMREMESLETADLLARLAEARCNGRR